MKKSHISLLFCVFLIFSCKQAKKDKIVKESNPVTIQVQGHRGERGHLPENSIAGFIEAIKDNVDIIEMDLVISKDSQVVVSHEAFMSSKYVSDPEGKAIDKEKEKSYNLYEMTMTALGNSTSGKEEIPIFPSNGKCQPINHC